MNWFEKISIESSYLSELHFNSYMQTMFTSSGTVLVRENISVGVHIRYTQWNGRGRLINIQTQKIEQSSVAKLSINNTELCLLSVHFQV